MEVADFGVGLGDFIAGGGGGFEGAETGFLLATQVGDLGEFRLGGGCVVRGAWGGRRRLRRCPVRRGRDRRRLGRGGRRFRWACFECGLGFGELGAGEFGFGAGFGFAGGGEEFVVGGGDVFADALVGGGLHDGGDAVFLEALDEGVLVGGGVVGGILAGTALPDPEVGPGGGELGGVGAAAGFGFEEFREFGVGFFVLEGGHAVCR